MSCSLNSLKGDIIEDYIGTVTGVIKGDTIIAHVGIM